LVSKERVKRVADKERKRAPKRSNKWVGARWKQGQPSMQVYLFLCFGAHLAAGSSSFPSPPLSRSLYLARSHCLRLTFRNFTTMARILFRCFGRLISQLFCFSLRFAFCCSLFLFLFFMHAFCLVFEPFLVQECRSHMGVVKRISRGVGVLSAVLKYERL